MNVETTPAAIRAACEVASALAPEEFPPDKPGNELTNGESEWYRFENRAWEIGEDIRQALISRPQLRANKQVQGCLMEVVRQRKLRRGRQPFVTNLAYKAAAQHAPELAGYLGDPDIHGQVLGALIKMNAPGHAREVRFLLNAKHAWIRNLAQKYLARFGEPAA